MEFAFWIIVILFLLTISLLTNRYEKKIKLFKNQIQGLKNEIDNVREVAEKNRLLIEKNRSNIEVISKKQDEA